MKARVKYLGYSDINGKRIKGTIIAQGLIIKDSAKQIVIRSASGTTSTIRKSNVLNIDYISDYEEIKYASL